MTRYLLFFLTGLAHVLVIMLYKELEGGPAAFYPVLGLAGAFPLFAVASGLTFFSMRAGAWVAMLSCLLLLPWSVAATTQALQSQTALSTVTIILHPVLITLAFSALVTSMRYVFRKNLDWKRGTHKPTYWLKLLLAAIPLLVATLFVSFI